MLGDYCDYHSLGIIEHPVNTTVFIDQSAIFKCNSTDDYIQWKVNGTRIYGEVSSDITIARDTQTFNSTLTIRGRAVYNGTSVQCVSGDVGNDTNYSIISYMTLQGMLQIHS